MILKIESDHKVKWSRTQAGLRYPSKTTSNCIFLTGRGFQPPRQEQWFQQPWVTRQKSQYGRKYTCKHLQTWNNLCQNFPRQNYYYCECCLWSQVFLGYDLISVVYSSRCNSHLIIDYWLLLSLAFSSPSMKVGRDHFPLSRPATFGVKRLMYVWSSVTVTIASANLKKKDF